MRSVENVSVLRDQSFSISRLIGGDLFICILTWLLSAFPVTPQSLGQWIFYLGILAETSGTVLHVEFVGGTDTNRHEIVESQVRTVVGSQFRRSIFVDPPKQNSPKAVYLTPSTSGIYGCYAAAIYPIAVNSCYIVGLVPLDLFDQERPP
jgi:hypothetical protein